MTRIDPAALREALDYYDAKNAPEGMKIGLIFAAARAYLDGEAWQPIETAPKDGTEILWRGDNGEYARKRYTYSVIRWPEYSECFAEGVWRPLPVLPEST